MYKKGLIGAIKYGALLGVITFVLLFGLFSYSAFAGGETNSPIFIETINQSQASGTEYAPLKDYGFEINITNSSTEASSGNCTFRTNLTGTWSNFTTSSTPDITFSSDGGNLTQHYINFTQEQVGNASTYNYFWICNSTTGASNNTGNVTYSIAQNASTGDFIYLALNDTQANYTGQTYPTVINATGGRNFSETQAINFTLYANDTLLGSTASGAAVEINRVEPAGYTIFEWNTSGNINYSSGSLNYNATINKANTTLSLYLNDTQANMQINNTGIATNATGLLALAYEGDEDGRIPSLYLTVYNVTHQSGTDVGLVGSEPINGETNHTFSSLENSFGRKLVYTINSTGSQNYSENSTGLNYNFTIIGYANITCTFENLPYFAATIGGSKTIECMARGNSTGAPIPNLNVSFYSETAAIATTLTNETGWTNYSYSPSSTSEETYLFNATLHDNSSTLFYNTSLNNVSTRRLYIINSVNPRPIIINNTGILTDFSHASTSVWGQIQSNYSFGGTMVYPNFTGGTFNGMVMPTERYAPLTYNNRNFWDFPTREEFLTYNLTFQINYTTSASTHLVNITAPTPSGRFEGANALYKNQTLLPARWATVELPIQEMMNGTDMPSMTVLMKNPDNFTVEWVNNTGGNGTIEGSMVPGTEAWYMNGQIVLNLTNSSPTENKTVKLMLGVQDETCIDQMLSENNDQWDEALFNQYCMQSFGPPKMESSPVYIKNQTVVGLNPFTNNLDNTATLNESGTTTFVLNVTNTLLNYTGNNIFVEYQIPINMTDFNTSTTVNMTEDHSMGWWNSATGKWETINSTSTPAYISSEGCVVNMTDNMPGSSMSGNLMTICFKAFKVNLSQTGISGADGVWSYGDVATLNLSMTNAFKILNLTTGVTTAGSPLGSRGNTSQYNFTVGGQQGLFKINTTTLPSITGSAGSSACRVGQGPSECSNITVRVNGQVYQNWTTGSIILNSQQNGVQSVSISYSVPAEASSTSSTTTDSVSTTTGGTTTTVEQAVAISSLPAGETKSMTFTEDDLAIESVSITSNKDLLNVELKITELSSLPSGTTSLAGQAYKYLNFEQTRLNEADLESAKVKFSVTKSWIEDNDIDEDSIALNRWSDDKWNKLETTKLSETSTHILYEANTAGFSYFAITGSKIVTSTEETTEIIDETTEEETTKNWYYVLFIIIIGLLIGGYYYYKNYYKKSEYPGYKHSRKKN